MGNTYSPPPFSLFVELPCLWLPPATHQKKQKKKTAAPREKVAIATAFTRATPQRVHLSYMFQHNLGICVVGQQGHWESSWAVSQDTQSKTEGEVNKESPQMSSS